METTQTSVISSPSFSVIGGLNAERPVLVSELRTPNSELLTSRSSRLTPQPSSLFIPIQVLSPELVLVDWGPMTLTISVWSENQPRPVMAVQTAEKALSLLRRLSEDQPLLKIPSGKFKTSANLPPLVKQAVSTCLDISPELTGMATIAGLVADELVSYALELGGDRIIVNNGGDIALGVRKGRKVRVGLKDPRTATITHVLEVGPEDPIGGIATSGWPGRSFSPGVADAVSVWANDCKTADAAATWIAGQMKLDSPKVIQRPANELDPDTDIPYLSITRDVLPLTSDEKEIVLEKGFAAAQELIAKGIVQGVFMTLQDIYRWIAIQEPFPPKFISI